MGPVCFHCGKGKMFGRSHTHHRGVAGGRWKKRAQKTQRVFKPNLHKVTIDLSGIQKKVRVCSKCLKRVRKDIKDGKKPALTVIHYQNTLKQTVVEPQTKDKKTEVATIQEKAQVAQIKS